MMTRQTSLQLTPATERQVEYLRTAGFGTLTDIVRIAIDRMAIQEGYTMTEDVLIVVESFDRNASGTIDTRLARIGNDWFVYGFSLTAGQIVSGNEFARHTPAGVRYLCTSMTEAAARAEYNRQKQFSA